MRVEFFVNGLPAPQGSKRAFVVGGRARMVESSGKVKGWRQDIAHRGARAWLDADFNGPAEGPFAVHVTFYLPRPKSHTGAKGLKPSAPRFPCGKPDADKLLRAVLDALTGIYYRDDSQVVDAIALKRYATGPIGARVVITTLNQEIHHGEEERQEEGPEARDRGR